VNFSYQILCKLDEIAELLKMLILEIKNTQEKPKVKTKADKETQAK